MRKAFRFGIGLLVAIVVIAIIVLLVNRMLVRTATAAAREKVSATEQKMISAATFIQEMGVGDTIQDGFYNLFAKGKSMLKDDWSTPFLFDLESSHTLTITSLGADRQLGTDDDIVLHVAKDKYEFTHRPGFGPFPVNVPSSSPKTLPTAAEKPAKP